MFALLEGERLGGGALGYPKRLLLEVGGFTMTGMDTTGPEHSFPKRSHLMQILLLQVLHWHALCPVLQPVQGGVPGLRDRPAISCMRP